jgi:hypothetical protein
MARYVNLAHPNVAKIYGTAVARYGHGIVVPWYEDGNIKKYLQNNKKTVLEKLQLVFRSFFFSNLTENNDTESQ